VEVGRRKERKEREGGDGEGRRKREGKRRKVRKEIFEWSSPKPKVSHAYTAQLYNRKILSLRENSCPM
jgi:hypothetical protein